MEDKIAIVINSLLYLLKKFEGQRSGFLRLFKILYFAEQKHLVKYGKTITNDVYAAMENGPVPSLAYDLVKYARGKHKVSDNFKEAVSLINIQNHYQVTAVGDVDLEWLSETERECLDESFEENKGLSFGQLSDKSHDSAWKSARHWMDKLKIAEAGGAESPMIQYIASKQELEKLRF